MRPSSFSPPICPHMNHVKTLPQGKISRDAMRPGWTGAAAPRFKNEREARVPGPLFRLSKSRVGSAAGCRLAEALERVQAAHQRVATSVGRRTLRGF